MRIISGLNKGKKLIMPKDKITRPLKDMAKESIFNILTHANYINFHLKDSRVLDLFFFFLNFVCNTICCQLTIFILYIVQ